MNKLVRHDDQQEIKLTQPICGVRPRELYEMLDKCRVGVKHLECCISELNDKETNEGILVETDWLSRAEDENSRCIIGWGVMENGDDVRSQRLPSSHLSFIGHH